MAKRTRAKGAAGRGKNPVEIPMTDLDAELEQDQDRGDEAGDIHAAGTPGGGSAYGGLAGTNIGDGDPDNARLEDALGSGVRENEELSSEELREEPADDAYSGAAGGAVGGTPANKRARGGRGARFAPDEPHRGDSTIGSEPDR